MAILFQILRRVFYFTTLIMWVFLIRGELFFWEYLFTTIGMVLMPGYLLFCGCMVGYLISLIWAGKSIDAQMSDVKENILKKSFLIGIIVGLALAMLFIFI